MNKKNNNAPSGTKKFRAFMGKMARAYKEAGYRERYAMMNGKRKTVTMNGHKALRHEAHDHIYHQGAPSG